MIYPNLRKYGLTEQFRREANSYEYAVNGRQAMNAGCGKYLNFIAILLRRK
jgi:hypothetical protein